MGWFSRFWQWLRGVDAAKLAAEVTKVQTLTASACRFVPTAASVASILTAGNPAVVGAGAVATAICQAVTGSRPLGLVGGGIPQPEVNGIVVEGEFLDQ